MGKKSRRQKQPAAEPYKYHHRFHHNSIMRHEDGSELSEAEEKQLATFFLQVRSTVDATHARSRYAPNLTHDWLNEYTFAVAYPRIKTKGLDSAIRALERWPRLQPYWPRLRRRVCDHCHSQVALSEPRYLVCGGCGVARYCCEECQRADWGWHPNTLRGYGPESKSVQGGKIEAGPGLRATMVGQVYARRKHI